MHTVTKPIVEQQPTHWSEFRLSTNALQSVQRGFTSHRFAGLLGARARLVFKYSNSR